MARRGPLHTFREYYRTFSSSSWYFQVFCGVRTKSQQTPQVQAKQTFFSFVWLNKNLSRLIAVYSAGTIVFFLEAVDIFLFSVELEQNRCRYLQVTALQTIFFYFFYLIRAPRDSLQFLLRILLYFFLKLLIFTSFLTS